MPKINDIELILASKDLVQLICFIFRQFFERKRFVMTKTNYFCRKYFSAEDGFYFFEPLKAIAQLNKIVMFISHL